MGMLDGRVVAVTGAGRGIGAATARVLAGEGAPGQPNYAAAKMGIVGLTFSCANALRGTA